ncbi:hypothetical protein [Haliscomenobacter hydrossis]|uniref:Uncharacterized protein n=1 Tax=Haliscomenobacter hydrossis (strain ATCC 27775 / DSM 1100 / LMG 10767 / O) TaxID=760192 RepID=F4KYL1_HALH1|nr:hypothetical protein [Haliscomenobacter hydrossis]AEE50417.1 hypothetical protein Halhy_2544 [Haliscomenobacter hydrossis DSM 1100]
MAFHKNDEPGKKISFAKAEKLIEENVIDLGSELGITSLSGFLSADILNEVLNDRPDCVGIRIYNATEINGLILVGVFSEGDELDENPRGMPGYVISRGTPEQMQFDRVTRRFAADTVWHFWKLVTVFDGQDATFASYFSARVIRELLQAEDCNGIKFYTVGLLESGKFPFTHLAVPAKHTPLIGIELRGQAGNCIICPDPCPPRCAPDAPIGNDIQDVALTESELRAAIQSMEPAEDVFETIAGTKYLIAWQQVQDESDIA